MSKNETPTLDMKVDLHNADGAWHAVIESDGLRRDIGGIDELIRYLESMKVQSQSTRRGLR